MNQEVNYQAKIKKKELEYQDLLHVRNAILTAQWSIPLAFFIASLQLEWIKDFASLAVIGFITWVAYRLIEDKKKEYDKQLQDKLDEFDGLVSRHKKPSAE